VDEKNYKTCSTSDLARLPADCRITVSPLNPGFDFGNLLSEIKDCKIVKDNNRRQVYHFQTPGGGCFLKCSRLTRTKDRLRHFFLPRRRWAEWRNLHHLWHSRISAARPLAKGESLKNIHPRYYFILTEQVPGKHIPFNSVARAGSLGRYAALLHHRGVYHADLNRKNFILNPAGEFYLLDTQEVYFPPYIPHSLRVNNLGRIIFNHCIPDDTASWVATFIKEYNRSYSKNIKVSEAIHAARRHQRRRYRSRLKRCCKNSTQFQIVKDRKLHGFKRRGFHWGAPELQQAEANGKPLKGTHVFSYNGVCIKKQRQRFFHQNRCLTSWKMSQALEARGIAVPRSLGYMKTKGQRYFFAELLDDWLHLNTYLSALSDERPKRQALKKLARWLKTIHDTDVWQRDFKSQNILCRDSDFFMIDLDGVSIRRLSESKKICNLAQLNASISNAISIKDRLRFYYYYSAELQLTRQQRRAVYRRVWDITKTKNTKAYNLDPTELLDSQIKAGPDKRL